MVEIPRGKVGLIYGKKGSGKSLYLARLAKRAMEKQRYVFSYSEEAGSLPLPEQYWLYTYPPDSVILIDEVSTIHRSRDFKTFPKECSTWYKMVRKMRLTVYLTSQVDDVDKSIRSLADYTLVLGGTGSRLQTGVWYRTTLVVAPKIDEDGVAVGAAEISMGLTRYGSKFRALYFQWGPLYYGLTDTYRLFGQYKSIDAVQQLPSFPEPIQKKNRLRMVFKSMQKGVRCVVDRIPCGVLRVSDKLKMIAICIRRRIVCVYQVLRIFIVNSWNRCVSIISKR